MTEAEKRNEIGRIRAEMGKRTDGDALADLSAAELEAEYVLTLGWEKEIGEEEAG
jgi:hypothetical protein